MAKKQFTPEEEAAAEALFGPPDVEEGVVLSAAPAKKAEEKVEAPEPTQAEVAMAQMQRQIEALTKQVGGIVPDKPAMDGTWNRNYDAKELRVHGGTEVRHAPGFRPDPPSSISKYVAKLGGTTDHLEVPFQDFYQFDAIGNPIMDEETGEQKVTRAPRGKAALLDEDGKPVLTDEYKYWLSVRQTGARLEGDVMTDIAAGKGLPQDAVFPDGAPDLASVGIE